MRKGHGLRGSVVALLTCASLVAYPCLIHARPFIQIEIDDTNDFGAAMKKFLAGEGFEGSQMQEFLQAPKREWSAVLDRFANQFGFSPRLISTLFSGRVVVRIDKDAFLVGSIQKDAEEVNALVAETRKLLESAADIKAKTEEGQDATRITVSVPGNVLIIGAKGNRFVLAGGRDQEFAEGLCDQFIVGIVESITDRNDICPELRGKGVLMMQDTSALLEEDDIVVDGRPARPHGMASWISGHSFTRMYFQDDDLWMIGYLPGRESLFGSLYVKDQVSESSLAWIPAGCESAAALHFNLAGLIPTLLENEGDAAGQPAPGMGIGQSLEMAKRTLGFDLQDEFLAHIGDEMVFGQLLVGKGGGFPVFSTMGLGSMYGVISLQNPMAFEAGLDKLLNFLGGMAAQDTVGGGLRRIMIGGLPVRYLRVACGVLSPCFAVKDNYLVVTSNIPLMKFLLANHGSWKPLAEDGDFRTNLALLSEKPTSGFSYKRYRHRDGGGGTTAALTGVAITGMLGGMLLPALGRARGEARKAMPPGPGDPGATGAPAPLTADSFNTFLAIEARNLAMSVDFALFPAVEDFSREGGSNISIVEVREGGIFSKAKIGHISGGSGDGMIAVAMIAIVAAIAIPSFLKAKTAALQPGGHP